MIMESLLGTDFLIKNAKEIQVVIDNNASEIEQNKHTNKTCLPIKPWLKTNRFWAPIAIIKDKPSNKPWK